MMTDGHGKVMSQDKEHMGTQFSLHKISVDPEWPIKWDDKRIEIEAQKIFRQNGWDGWTKCDS